MFPFLRLLVIDVDERVHTIARPCCADMTCPCHTDEDTLFHLGVLEAFGILTAEEVKEIYQGVRSLFPDQETKEEALIHQPDAKGNKAEEKYL